MEGTNNSTTISQKQTQSPGLCFKVYKSETLIPRTYRSLKLGWESASIWMGDRSSIDMGAVDWEIISHIYTVKNLYGAEKRPCGSVQVLTWALYRLGDHIPQIYR